MSLQEIREKIKVFKMTQTAFVGVIVALTALASFSAGALFVGPPEDVQAPITVTLPAAIGEAPVLSGVEMASTAPVVSTSPNTEGTYVGSRKGSKYHLPWCSGAKRISDENKVWFTSKEEAEQAGYTPAANCKGI